MLSFQDISARKVEASATTLPCVRLVGNYTQQTLSLRIVDGGVKFAFKNDKGQPFVSLNKEQYENFSEFQNNLKDLVTSLSPEIYNPKKFHVACKESKMPGEHLLKLSTSEHTKWYMEAAVGDFTLLDAEPELKSGFRLSITINFPSKPWVYKDNGQDMWGFNVYADEVIVYPCEPENRKEKVSIIQKIQNHAKRSSSEPPKKKAKKMKKSSPSLDELVDIDLDSLLSN